MKDFKSFLNARTYSPDDIAKKHNVLVEYLQSQLKIGIQHEKEHTTRESVAREIALDHLNEDPDYYKKLKE
ncbi:hypothetical protein [Caulobacter phage Cr30]|uniref:hypothetical protein n=1 Tax=Caulobacter phage Cr30 TaxID=1357714 RepID=UPI0004A9BB40|nr:hypothetical protein OZ74_gp177 [Caulobacter phage Cr30]AGS81166.1 hypothetical protein [Caulobacter phage Cr30]